ncbi:calcium/proton exchanger [Blastomyces parvus]|uniref:Calcium/proton exchanger n=1 Tax=Blastomyces parvus TaxID=2060905 RepID=A0A2B7WTG4_9EURO|nr:calcium/proton exchanger [Blastomyces parvus]
MNESSDDPPLIHRIARRFQLRAAAHEDSRGVNNRSNHDHNHILPITNPSAQKHDPDDKAGNEPSCQDESKPIPTTEAASVVSLSASATNDTGSQGNSATIGAVEKGSLIIRIYHTIRLIILSSWINWGLVFVPLGIALGAVNRSMGDQSPISPTVVFSINAVAIIPLASLLSFATENAARNLSDKIGALLNVTFGNAVELIIFIALVAKEVRIVQASLLGSILANLLLILGMCFLFGGLRYREQLYNSNITQMSAALLSLSVMSLLLPTAFHASFNNMEIADAVVLKVSRGTSVILLLVYVLYLLFQLKSHAYFYESTPQHKIDEESHPGVLADMLNSSSSSESSSSSDSDTDRTSGSYTRTKRIKNALKKRRRRRRSINSKDPRQSFSSTSVAHTVPSSSSPMTESCPSQPEGHSEFRSPSVDRADSGDEADTDEANKIRHSPRSHPVCKDFAGPDSSINFHGNRQKRTKKCHNHNEGNERMDIVNDPVVQPNNQVDHPTSDSTPHTHAKRQVNFAPDATNSPEPTAAKRPLAVRSLSNRQVLPRVFTNRPHLYSTQSTTSTPFGSQCSSGGSECGLRRSNSHPGRLQSPFSRPIMPSAQPLPHLMAIVPSQSPDGIATETRGSCHLSRTASIILLVVSTALVAVCAEFLVDSIEYLVENTGLSQAFIGLIILPIVGNAAEHITAVVVAGKNKMDLAIGVALGSSIQIALFVTPVIVLLGWCLNTEMSLYFSLFETVSLFASAFIVNYLVLDGRTNYLEGALLISAYVIIALAAFFYPSCENLSMASGPHDAAAC